MRIAGIVARYFGMDPLEVLNGSYRDLAIRVAAYQYSKKKENEAEEARAKAIEQQGRRPARHR